MGTYILVVTEPKLDSSVLNKHFCMAGDYPPFRADGGGIIIYVRDDIPCMPLRSHPPPTNFEGRLLEIIRNISKSWPSINTGLDNVHVIFCIYEQEACYVINILYIVTVY